MINKFSESVRRNQKQWMVVITILAVFSFVFDDLIRGAGSKMPSGNIIFIAVFCAAGMSILGYRRGKTTEFGLTGLVVGGLVAYLGMKAAGPPVVVHTNVRNFTRLDLNLLRSRRQRAEQFLTAAVKKIDKGQSAPRFGQVDDYSMVSFALMHTEARRMGVSVTDESVNQFLSRATQNKMTAKNYNETLHEVGMTEIELFTVVRGELEVQMVAQLISTPADAHPTMMQFTRGAYSGRIARQTPEQLWQSFCKMHVRQAMTTVAVPVADFVALVPEPTETELHAFFDKYKHGYGDEQGTPGFLEPPKVRLAYLAVSNLEAYEKQVPKITDQEVVDYYLTNKESYRMLDLPEPGSKLPDLMQDPTSNGSAPADATRAENTDHEKAAAPPTDAVPETKPPETKTDGDQPAVPEKPATPDKPKVPADKEGDAKGESPCDDEPVADKQAVPPDATVQPETAAAEAVEPPAKADDKSPPAPALPGDDTTADATAPQSGTGPGTSASNSLPLPPPVARYRELDEDLKDQIRQTILLNKALLKMGETADKALEMMMELSLKYMALDPKERDKAAGKYAEELKAYAEQHGLEYKETKELSRFELMTTLDEPLSGATDPATGANAARTPISVVDEVFTMEDSGRRYRLSVYSPRRADTRGARYSYWKILEVPAKVPELKDAIVRKKVLDAYKFENARPLAKKRANALAELMKDGKADIAAALSGQTINGTTDSPAATIRETPKFSWLRLPHSLPQFGLQQPVQSTIEGISQPGYSFMKTVFDELGDGEAGVAVNASHTSYFAVRVHDRDGSVAEGDGIVTLHDLQTRFSREQFTGSDYFITAYEFIGAGIQQDMDYRWREGFRKRYGIEFEKTAANGADEE